jgi:pimeloyl-ACP methyl ester carboxylesterase
MRILILICLLGVIACPSFCAKPAPLVYVAKGVEGKLPVAVWLHGYRNFPGALGDAEYYQGVADRLGIAIVGIPGTATLDDETLQWSEEPVADHAYIQSVLQTLAGIHSLDLNRVGLFGFSQGAMVAGDLALLYPHAYRGALIMSPGGFTHPHFPRTKNVAHSKQSFIVVCGVDEHPGNVEWAKAYGEVSKEVTQRAELKLYEGMKEHTRPPDFKTRFPVWIGEMLDASPRG